MDRIFVYGVDGNDQKVHDISDPETGQGYFSDYVKAQDEGKRHRDKCPECEDFRVEGPDIKVWGRAS